MLEKQYSLKQILVVGMGAVALWQGAYQIAVYQAGVKPTQKFTPQAQRSPVDALPTDINELRTLAQNLGRRYQESPAEAKKVVFEFVHVLSQLLKQDPKDTQALIALANISFEQQVFDKAAEHYQRYLELKPEDTVTRARYGSTLTFLGQFDESITELEKVLTVDPKNFQATAYLAITYAEKGDKEKALEIGSTAIDIAPSAEARERFSKFLAHVQDGEKKFAPEIQKIVDHVANNPIAGPKFQTAELTEEGALKLYFKDFPMDQMPPFAKDKFIGGIKDVAGKTEVQLLDQSTDRIMEVIGRAP